MIETFFTTIPGCLFEPVAVCAGLGILLALYLHRKKQDCLFYLAGGSLFFMIVWRVGLEVGSKRYAAILILAAVILVSYLCFHLKELPGMTKVPEKLLNVLPWSLILIMVGVCLGKDFHFNRYDGYLRKCADVARRDSSLFRYPIALTKGDEVGRVGYYSKLETLYYGKDIAIAWNTGDISDILEHFRYFGDAIYLFLDESGHASPVTAKELGISEREWSMLATSFQNNRRKKRLTLYRYLPGPIPWKIATKMEMEQIQQHNQQEVLFNGLFDQAEDQKRFLPFLQTLKGSTAVYYAGPDWRFPAGWDFDSRVSNVNTVEAGLQVSTITGKPALRLAGSSRYFIVFTRNKLPLGKYALRFLVHGQPGTQFGIAFYSYDKTGRFVSFREAAHFRLTSGESYLYHFQIAEREIGKGAQFRLCLVLYKGEIFWDGVSLLPVAEAENEKAGNTSVKRP